MISKPKLASSRYVDLGWMLEIEGGQDGHLFEIIIFAIERRGITQDGM